VTALRVRAERSADVTDIREVVAEAYASEGQPDPPEVGLVEALRGSDAWLPELSIVAEADARVVGYALLTRVTVGDEAQPALALGPVAVRPIHQRLGYGTAVVRAALDAAAELDERLVLVLGDPSFYGRFGFEPAARFGVTSRWPGARYQALTLPAYGSGEHAPRGAVRYPPAWAVV
jgi:putative acetyltransferase